MKSYEIKNMIVDENLQREETVTADFIHNDKPYSISFNKADLELINAWVFEGHSSLPANLSVNMIEAIREEVKKRI